MQHSKIVPRKINIEAEKRTDVRKTLAIFYAFDILITGSVQMFDADQHRRCVVMGQSSGSKRKHCYVSRLITAMV
jgi:hypothetical protein